jgi:uncharacterized membrane protein YdfJ with MMPL/SSD domain
MLDALARFLHRSRRRVLVAAVLLVSVAGAFGGPVAGLLDADDDFDDAAAESVVAREDIARATGMSATPDLIALVRDADRAAAVKAQLDDPDVARVDGPVLSKDGEQAYFVAFFRDGAEADEAAARIEERFTGDRDVLLGGGVLAQEQVGEQVSEDLAKAEMLAFPLLFLVSLLVFRSLVAALLPLAVGMATILTTFAFMRIANAIEPMSIFALNLIIGLGLGLAIDYSLFVVSRFREEMARSGNEVVEALRITMRTAGRTVLFSSVTVAAALASLTVFPQRFLFSMGIGGALVSLVAALVALTLLPALLAALGPRVDALSPKRFKAALARDAAAERAGFWYRLSQGVMRRPVGIAVGTAAVLLVLGSPFLRIEFTSVDASVLPPERSARAVADTLERDFPAGLSTPVTVALEAPGTARDEIAAYADRLAALPGAADVAPAIAESGGLWRIDLAAAGSELDESAQDFVRSIRDAPAPYPARVAGFTAENVDRNESLAAHLPYAGAILAITTLVILFLMTGSVVLPIKTLVMNVLSLSAAFGILVLVFQDGRLEGLLDYTSQGALEATQPILLFALAFGLSTDYGVFLLTRIKEARDAGRPDEEAVALGLERTGRIVTAAAILFVIAIGAFATSQIIFIKQVGVGTALAVLIDATIVRALLVPSLMRLLGKWNWWAPRPLARLHARFGLSEAAA